MSFVRLSSKYQLTLPAKICRRLQLKKGDRFLVEVKGEQVILTRVPEDFTEFFAGSARGVYGTSAAEIDEYIRKERETWE
ncbi:MAG: AbrB/MazE/SpoVT family DNA-binding domain-containing protein [Bacillota bacterium]